MSDFKMKIEAISGDKDGEKPAEAAKEEMKAIKSEETAPKSPGISFDVGDFCLVKRPADNIWRKLLKYSALFVL